MSRKIIPPEIIIFSKRLAQAMADKGLKQGKLAQLANTEQGTISKYLNGLVDAPDSNILRRISIVLDVSVDWLLGKGSETDKLFAEQIAAAGQLPADQPPPVEYQGKGLMARLGRATSRLSANQAEDRHRPDRSLLRNIISLLEDYCTAEKIVLTADQKGSIISHVYEVHQDTAKPVTLQTVITFIELYR